MPRMFVPAIAALVLVGCVMDMDHDEMNGAFADARAEVQRHSTTCQGAPTADATTTEFDRHELAMERMFKRMEGDMRGMHHCGNMDGMGKDITDMREMLQTHRTRVREAEDLGEVHGHCASYGNAMIGLCDASLQRMRTQGCM